MPDATQLEVFPAPSDTPFVIEHVSEEFTSVCPKTGHPDFGDVLLRYQPKAAKDGGTCVELKSLKMYYQSFRNEGIFYEAVTNQIRDDLVRLMDPAWLQIRDDLVRLMDPAWLQIVTMWKGRGGIKSNIRADHGNVPAHYLGR